MRKKKWLLRGCILIVLLTIYGWRQSLDENFLELSTCPACYGQGLCRDIFDESPTSKKISLTGYSQWRITRLLNIKNVYFGESDTVSVVIKKLAHDSELLEYDKFLCESNKEESGCNVGQAKKSLLSKNNNNIAQVVNRYPRLFEKSEGVKCNHNRVLYHLYDNFLKLDSGPYQYHHFLTLLAINMEPLILNAYQNGWFPALHGMCGRVIIEEYVGPTLTQLVDAPWLTRANYARQLIEMAQDFSSGDFQLYMTDVSLDNFAVDTNGQVKIIDAENIVMSDPDIDGLDRTEHINEGFGCQDCLSFSYEDLCGHALADHNFFAICKGILSTQSFSRDLPKGLLHSPPDWVKEQHPTLFALVEDCARPSPHSTTLPRRREAATVLLAQLLQVLQKTGRA